ncbi:MAG TPA: MotA/TolQ/ExbB proton channel family protein [Planctomycetaceae bacterium]|nr:MotA/TolQ/ExbB proton channel family protein [Planctomycetaceae bacterium]
MSSTNTPSPSPARRAWPAWLALAAGGLALCLAAFVPAGAFGQEPDEAPAGEAAPAAQPADQPAGDAAAPSDASDGATTKRESFLSWMIRANGPLWGPIFLLLSFVMVALVVMNVMQIRRDTLLPPEFVESFEQRLAAKDYQGAYDTAKNDDSFVARVLAAGLSKLNRGYEEAIEGMQEVGEDENMALEHRLSYLALIGTVAPMLGLMGTVHGMILSFQVIANSTEQPKPAELADGISTALFTTLEGLTIAIPALIAYNLLRNRVSRFVLEVGIVSEGLMSRFSQIGKRPATAGGAAPAAAPAAPKDV